MKINMNERAYDYIRELGEADQWKEIKSHFEVMDYENFRYTMEEIYFPISEIDKHKDNILKHIDNFLEYTLGESFLDREDWDGVAFELECEFKGQYPLKFKGKDMELEFKDYMEFTDFLQTPRTRDIFPILDGKELQVPGKDYGGGLVGTIKLEMVEEESNE